MALDVGAEAKGEVARLRASCLAPIAVVGYAGRERRPEPSRLGPKPLAHRAAHVVTGLRDGSLDPLADDGLRERHRLLSVPLAAKLVGVGGQPHLKLGLEPGSRLSHLLAGERRRALLGGAA